MKAYTIAVCIILTACQQLSAQREEALYEFKGGTYNVSSWVMDGRMNVSIDKYGSAVEKRKADIDTLLDRLNSEKWKADVQELNDPGLMPTVRKLLGYYEGIDSARYTELVERVKARKADKADTTLNHLLKDLFKDTSHFKEAKESITQLAKDTISLAKMIGKLKGGEKLKNPFSTMVNKLDKNWQDSLLRACANDTSTSACLSSLSQILKSASTDYEKRLNALREVIKTMSGKAGPMIKGYDKAVSDRTAELRKSYRALPSALDTLAKACANTGSEVCISAHQRTMEKLKDEVSSTHRELNFRLPLAQDQAFFTMSFSDALMDLSKADSAKSEADRLAEVNFYRLLAIITASPTPTAGELCINRNVKVFRRMTPYQVWVERKARHEGKCHPGVIIKGWEKCIVTKDPKTKDLLAEIEKAGYADSSNLRKIEQRMVTMNRINSRFLTDRTSNPYHFVVISRTKYNRKHIYRRMEHHVMSSKSMRSVDQHDRFDYQVSRAAFKFEDGVLNDVVVEGVIKEPFRFLKYKDGNTGHYDSIPVAHHFQPWCKDSIVNHTICRKVTFTNSNTPIPFGNVWNLYERFLDRMPLYGYAGTGGVSITVQANLIMCSC